MAISHEEAQRLIQLSLDQALRPHDKDSLQDHLTLCHECHEFLNDIQEVGNLLAPVMKRKWNAHPTPLSLAVLVENSNTNWPARNILTIRMAIFSMILALFVMSTWQFTQVGSRGSNPMTAGVLPVPTPSSHSTSTRISFPNCRMLTYQVQPDDSLESIAHQFSTSRNEIIALNSLTRESLIPGAELIIPLCNFTPTGTLHPSTLTTTHTPFFGATTSTPGG